MTSPFPGVDPYLEAQGLWHGFHNKFLAYMDDILNQVLPENYFSRTDERIGLMSREAGRVEFRPDVMVVKNDLGRSGNVTDAAVATVEPVTIPLAKTDDLEVREVWLEIRKLPDEELITVVELLSPTNKVGRGRVEYLEKRDALIDQSVNLVELDFLLAGARLPMRRPLPAAHYYAFMARAERRPDADVYAWSVRQPLPGVPIPLKTPDPDVRVDLNAIFQMTFERGRYGMTMRYGSPLELPLSEEDRAWAEGLRSSP